LLPVMIATFAVGSSLESGRRQAPPGNGPLTSYRQAAQRDLHLRRAKDFAPTTRRTVSSSPPAGRRRLTDDECPQLGKALSMAAHGDVWQPAVDATQLMIITGWRHGEVLGLRWSEVDLPRRTARLADTNSGASLRPLSDAACA
jgi:integrase